jgi:hypothetical protein
MHWKRRRRQNCGGATPEKDGAPVPGSPGLQAISFNTSCEIEIARIVMQGAGQVAKRPHRGESAFAEGDFALTGCWPNGSPGQVYA